MLSSIQRGKCNQKGVWLGTYCTTTVDDIQGFQAFTIQNLDNKLSTDSDTEQYKLLIVKEDLIDNCQQYLVIMCFPSPFSTAKFGEHHPRAVKLSHSERLLPAQPDTTSSIGYRCSACCTDSITAELK